LSLVPPLTLIFVVLGSIILGIATVNQAGAIGAVGAIVMAGYRLTEGKRGQYLPTVLAVISLTVTLVLINNFNLNVKNISTDRDFVGVILAVGAVLVFVFALVWSCWRAYKINNTLVSVMIDTAKTTSMVFIILIGAAMLTSAFRAFGGEELVKEFLTGLPGGFWTQFMVVMLVIFLLGFFLDFIEIAVVVVPIVAPILLSDPSANITAVWLGVMIGLNIQTSFLTPPFGFALFYLRGVAPPEVRTTDIYKGAVAFIMLQLVGLAIAGYFPSLVNYMPNRTALTAETAPPPVNPKLQLCIEEQLFSYYDENQNLLLQSIERVRTLDLSVLPESHQTSLEAGFEVASQTFEHVAAVKSTQVELDRYIEEYLPLHTQVRSIQTRIRKLEDELEDRQKQLDRISRRENTSEKQLASLNESIEKTEQLIKDAEETIPAEWEEKRSQYLELAKSNKTARVKYRRNVDEAYEPVQTVRGLLTDLTSLQSLETVFAGIDKVIESEAPEAAMEIIKQKESEFGEVEGVSHIKSLLSKSRRELKGDLPDRDKALQLYTESKQAFAEELEWRKAAVESLLPGLNTYNNSIYDNIGLRLQKRLPKKIATEVASCLSHHKNISLHF
jgi:TRAP-type C4-dicarboxylate transport system permease large subunit/TolA-binding protein